MLTMWRLNIVVLMCLIAGTAYSNPPPIAPSKDEEKNQTKTNDKEQPAGTDQRGTESSPLFIKVVPPLPIEPRPADHAKQTNDYSSPEWGIVWVTLGLAVITAILAAYTAKLWGATKSLAEDAEGTAERQAGEMQETLRIARESAKASRDAADIARDAMVAGERAFVFAIGIKAFWTKNPTTGLYHWQFRPQWQNSGDTPTKHMTMLTECELRDTLLPPGFNFDDSTLSIGKALIPPNTLTLGGIAPVTPVDPYEIIEVQAGRKFLYLWGWARYSDVFPGTPKHITRYCWNILAVGDPLAYMPPEPNHPDGLIFQTLHHNEGNCADDECNQ